MKTEKINWNIVLFSIVLVLSIFITCTTVTPTNESQYAKFPIKLSLGQIGNTTITYGGKDIDLIIEFPDSIIAEIGATFNIHMSLNAIAELPAEVINNSKVLSLTIPIHWKSTSLLPFDSAVELPFDTVYIDAGLNKSNAVQVYIENIPPQIVSYTVGDSSYIVPSHITEDLEYSHYIKDTTADSLSIIIGVTDYDNTFSNVWWSGISITDPSVNVMNYLIHNINNSKRAQYHIRSGNFIDLISSNITDMDKQITIKVNMIKSDRVPAKILKIMYADSFGNDTTFNDTTISKYVLNVVAINTASFRAYPYASGGSARWSGRTGIIVYDSAIDTNGFAISYVCTLSNSTDTLVTDTSIFLDSIQVVHFNQLGDDSTVKKISIYQVPLNQGPVIDSLKIEDTTFTQYSATTGYLYDLLSDSTIDLEIYAHDPDTGTGVSVSFLWQKGTGFIGALSDTVGNIVSYSAEDSIYVDTLYITASDNLGFESTRKIVLDIDTSMVFENRRIISTRKID